MDTNILPILERYRYSLLLEKLTWGKICTSITSCCSSESSCIVVSPVVFIRNWLEDLKCKKSTFRSILVISKKIFVLGKFFWNLLYAQCISIYEIQKVFYNVKVNVLSQKPKVHFLYEYTYKIIWPKIFWKICLPKIV